MSSDLTILAGGDIFIGLPDGNLAAIRDDRLDRAAVDEPLVDPAAEVIEVLERALGTRREDRLDRRAGPLPAGRLAATAPEQQLPLHLHDRLSRAQGKPEGDQGLARSGEAEYRNHHSQSKDIREREAGVPGGLG